jgi:PAS domain S-box-containing protein
MALSVFTLVLLAQILNLLPDRNTPIMKARQLQTQTLAMTGTAMASSKKQLRDFRKVLEHAVEADDSLLSAGLRTPDKKLLIEIAEHNSKWAFPAHGKSTDKYMFVPIFQGDKDFGQLELRYKALTNAASLLTSPIMRFGACLFAASLLIFYVILGRTLKQLDPRGAVPKHVREAFDQMAEGLIVMDRNSSIMMANSKFGALVGIEPDNLVGQNCSEFPWAETSELPWEQAVRSQQSVSNLTLQIEDQTSTPRTFSVSAAPVFSGKGACRGVMVTFDDITALEEHKLELIEARKIADAANEAKSNFLSRMSHEIRTPMNAIIGYADILREGVANQADQNQYLSTIHSSGEHLMTLINDILDLSKIEAGQMTLENRRFSIAPLLVQVIDTLRLQTDQKDLELKLKIEGSIPQQIDSDETRLRQVLINIIGNAVKFTKRGGVMVVARMTEDGKQLEFDIADTGVGIPQSALQNIFKPFSQADSSVTRNFGGTGLGLTICKELTEAMGGSISVRSQENAGTVFSFSINPGEITDQTQWLSDDNLHSLAQDRVETNPANLKFRNGHALIVDDGKTNRKLAGLLLKRCGLTFEEAANGQEAIALIETRQFDIVLMDISMPVMDGLTAASILREKGIAIPLVALTAMASQEERTRCLEQGFDEFLPKPIRTPNLIQILQKYLPLPIESKNALTSPQDLPSKTIEVDPLQGNSLKLPDVVRSTLPMDEEIKELLIDYVQRLRVRLGDIDEAWNSGNIEDLKAHAHWLAGSSGTIGLNEFVQPAKEIQNSDGSNSGRIAQLLKHIHDLFERIDLSEEALPA